MLKKFTLSMVIASSIFSGVCAQEPMNNSLASVQSELSAQLDDVASFVLQPLADIVRDYVTSLNNLKNNLLMRNDLDADTAKMLQDELNLAESFNQDIISYVNVVTVSLHEIISDLNSACAQKNITRLENIMRDLQRLKETGVEMVAKFKQTLNAFNRAVLVFAPMDMAMAY
jgi:hypothetical protein